AVVDRTEAGAVVSRAADCDVEPVRAAECERSLHVRDVATPRDDRGTLVDHRVVDLARFLVTSVVRSDDVAPNLRPKLVETVERGERRHVFAPLRRRETPR